MDYNKYNDYELLYMISENDEDALNDMFIKYENLIKKLACEYKEKYNDVDYQDLIQEGRIGLFDAIKRYKENFNTLFYTYAIICIKGYMNNYIRKLYTKTNIKFSITAEDIDLIEYKIKDNNEDLISYINDKDYYNKIIEFKNNLSFINSLVFELRFNNFKYKDIATLLDIDIKKVDNSMLTIKSNLKKYLLNL